MKQAARTTEQRLACIRSVLKGQWAVYSQHIEMANFADRRGLPIPAETFHRRASAALDFYFELVEKYRPELTADASA